MGARMPCFPNLDSPSVVGASDKSYRANRHWPHSSRLQAEARKREKLKDLPAPMEHHSCFPRLDHPLPECRGFPVWTVHLCSSWRPLRPSCGHCGLSWIALGSS